MIINIVYFKCDSITIVYYVYYYSVLIILLTYFLLSIYDS
jgi:hypothetical protein